MLLVPVTIQLDSAAMQNARRVLSPILWQGRIRSAMEESLAYLQGLVQAETPVNTGKLRGSIFTEIRGMEPEGLRGMVATPLFYGTVVEFGRRPGQRMPPVSVIASWIQQKRGLSVAESMRAAWPIARAIGRRGIPGRFMFRNAAARGTTMVVEIFRRWLSGSV